MRTIGLVSDRTSDEIPASHRDLVECPPVAALTTLMRDGYPQTSVVWCDFDGECVRVAFNGCNPLFTDIRCQGLLRREAS